MSLKRTYTPRWLWKFDAEHRLLAATSAAIVSFFVLPKTLAIGLRSVIAWDIGVGSLLLLAWSVILSAHPRQIRHRARTDDTNRLVVAVLVISAASASLFAVLFLLQQSKQLLPAEKALEVALSTVAVAESWLIVHTTFTIHYAHRYYSSPASEQQTEVAGGLEFPNQSQLDYLDFAYFAFTMGMTAQTSDVQVTSWEMRRLVLVHGLLSFTYNTVIVALSVSIISQVF